jgi:nucleotide-binding universal stress UspA family protein
MFKKILVPLDGSPLAEKALPYAEALAEKFEAELILVWVIQQPILVPLDYGGTIQPSLDAIILQQKQAAQEYLSQLQAQLRQRQRANRIVILESASVAEAIIDLANQEEADLIVKTTHGRSGPSRWLFGNVALRVLQQAPCPVFLVRVKAGDPSQ